MTPEQKTIKATYNGYTGIAYGRSSYEIRDKDNLMIFHTGFLDERPTNEEECLEELKKVDWERSENEN